jgi:hypothetical protein
VFQLARIMGTSVRMIEHHYGAMLDGAGAGIADRLDLADAEDEARAPGTADAFRSLLGHARREPTPGSALQGEAADGIEKSDSALKQAESVPAGDQLGFHFPPA